MSNKRILQIYTKLKNTVENEKIKSDRRQVKDNQFKLFIIYGWHISFIPLFRYFSKFYDDDQEIL